MLNMHVHLAFKWSLNNFPRIIYAQGDGSTYGLAIFHVQVMLHYDNCTRRQMQFQSADNENEDDCIGSEDINRISVTRS
jgi:hypothetical protein